MSLTEEASQGQEQVLCLPLKASSVNWTQCGQALLAMANVTEE